MTVFKLQSHACEEQEEPYPEAQPLPWAASDGSLYAQRLVFPWGPCLSRRPDANQWAAIQKSVFFPSFSVWPQPLFTAYCSALP